jgi:hypothetical protein
VSEVFKGPSRKMEHGTSREHGRMAYKQKNQSNKKKPIILIHIHIPLLN